MKADQDKRFFTVQFKNGNTLSVYPSRDDPLRFDTRVIVSRTDSNATRLRTEIPVEKLLSKGLKLDDDWRLTDTAEKDE